MTKFIDLQAFFAGTGIDTTPRFDVTDTTADEFYFASGMPYSGPVAGLQFMYDRSDVTDSLNITPRVANSFIHTGSGNDAISVFWTASPNVLDGGTGSNFLVGGFGNDTFFVDDRNAHTDIWSTVAGFHAGDSVTVWGVSAADFPIPTADGEGAAGYQGLTMHIASPDHTASATLAGYSQADMSNGRLSTSFGQIDGNSYMYVHGN